jgi:2-polyprenyl-6-methoxyphenol hydroxylase-like FAD-dependent oxidoreductase
MKGIIIGAGIGGLTTAIAFKKAGIDYHIMEAAPELKPVGAGIVMASNAMQVFQRLGIAEKIKSVGLEIEKADVVDQSFKLISALDVKNRITPRYGIGSFAFHRGRLQQALLSEIDEQKLMLNKRLVSLEQKSDSVLLHFEDESSVEADFVIGADGIKSAVRKSILGDVSYRYTHQTCWRGMSTYALTDNLKSNSYEMWGKQKGLRFGFVPTGENEVYFFTTYYTDANGKDEPGKVKEKLLELYSVFGKIPTQLIQATPEERIIRSDISDFTPIAQWHKGKVALLGDAAHATTPNLGQGGCQAVEDAFVVAHCLKSENSIQQAFAKYQSIRYQKAVHVVNMSWRLSEMTNIGNSFLQGLRNGAMRLMPESMTIRELDKILKLNY